MKHPRYLVSQTYPVRLSARQVADLGGYANPGPVYARVATGQPIGDHVWEWEPPSNRVIESQSEPVSRVPDCRAAALTIRPSVPPLVFRRNTDPEAYDVYPINPDGPGILGGAWGVPIAAR